MESSPNNTIESRIQILIDLLKPKTKSWENHYRELLSNEQVLKEIEILNSNGALLTQKGFRNYVREKFPEHYETVRKRYFNFYLNKNYSKESVQKAKEILESGNGLLYCLETIQLRHIRETEILLLLLCSGISSGFRSRELTLHLMAIGQSGKGKSASMSTASKVFSEIQIINSSSAKSQFYKAQSGDMIDNGLLIYDESDCISKESQALERVYTDRSSRVPSHETLKPNTHEFMRLEINEINVVWRNSINTPDDDENQLSNRYLIYNVDESKEQDELVFDAIVENFGFGKTDDEKDLEIAKIVTDLIKEKQYKVFIPFFKQITSNNKSNRRTIQKFLSLLWSITYFNRFKRETIGEYLVSTIEDFSIAKIIWDKINQTEAMQLPNKYLKVLAILESKDEMEVKEISEHPDIGVSEATIRRRLKEMKELGYVDFRSIYDENSKSTKYLWRAYQRLSRVFIEFAKEEFTIKTFNTQILEFKKKIGHMSFQNIKYNDLIEKLNLDDLYQKIIQNTDSFEKLKSHVEKNKDSSKEKVKTQDSNNLDNEILMKSPEKCQLDDSYSIDDIEEIDII